MKLCERCNKPHDGSFGSGRFCSRFCAAAKKHSAETKQKISKSVIKFNSNIIRQTERNKIRHCSICGSEYTIEGQIRNNIFAKGSRIVCSKECLTKYKSNNSKKLHEKLVKENRFKGWTSRNIISYPEQFFKKVLESNDIEYKFNSPIKKSELGINDERCYFLDFLIYNKIDLEIDGKQHRYPDRAEHDKIRDDALIKSGYIVYRISWNEINSEKGKLLMKEKIDKFLNWLKSFKSN